MHDFLSWASPYRDRLERALGQHLPRSDVVPQRLHEAMRYVLLDGGKRVRGLLTYAGAEFCGANPDIADYPAIAVEMIHAYSLVHDDLPCMDNDDLRRGKPSCHKQFDEATAMLVGDALQSLAFQVVSAPCGLPAAQQMQWWVHLLAKACGSRGMAGGQAMDMDNTGQLLTQTELEQMHLHKTGALIRASALMGAYSCAQPDPDRVHALDQFAMRIGLLFQVIDDLLDSEADTATLGKTAGKDAACHKLTYVSLLGTSRARDYARTLQQEALEAIAQFDRAAPLQMLAAFITQRSF